MDPQDSDYTPGPLLIIDEAEYLDVGGMAELTRCERAIILLVIFGASFIVVLCLYLFWEILNI